MGLELGSRPCFSYLGHLQGTTQMFAALSSSAELRGQVSLAAMLAPAVYMRFISSVPMVTLANIQLDRVRRKEASTAGCWA